MLPENKPKSFNKTPTKFFIWGESMSGKTYLARQFPNPILLNTDGNGNKVDTPSVDIKSYAQFISVIKELEVGNHTFQTIIIDLIDDIALLLSEAIMKKYNVSSLGEVSYGNGWHDYKEDWIRLMHRIASLKYNVVFISHIIERTENNDTRKVPSLSARLFNSCMGRCDLQIQTYKVGSRHMKRVISQRDIYKVEDIQDKTILTALQGTIDLFK